MGFILLNSPWSWTLFLAPLSPETLSYFPSSSFHHPYGSSLYSLCWSVYVWFPFLVLGLHPSWLYLSHKLIKIISYSYLTLLLPIIKLVISARICWIVSNIAAFTCQDSSPNYTHIYEFNTTCNVYHTMKTNYIFIYWCTSHLLKRWHIVHVTPFSNSTYCKLCFNFDILGVCPHMIQYMHIYLLWPKIFHVVDNIIISYVLIVMIYGIWINPFHILHIW